MWGWQQRKHIVSIISIISIISIVSTASADSRHYTDCYLRWHCNHWVDDRARLPDCIIDPKSRIYIFWGIARCHYPIWPYVPAAKHGERRLS
jgi:hypothetical protein